MGCGSSELLLKSNFEGSGFCVGSMTGVIMGVRGSGFEANIADFRDDTLARVEGWRDFYLKSTPLSRLRDGINTYDIRSRSSTGSLLNLK